MIADTDVLLETESLTVNSIGIDRDLELRWGGVNFDFRC
jgi:hypothetical protein